jgi:hypothetical protein
LLDGLDVQRAMAIGTADLTAMLCVITLEEAGITSDKLTVLLTCAAGGVRSVATSILYNHRNASLRGVESIMCPVDRRKEARRRRVSSVLRARIGQTVSLDELADAAERISPDGCATA